MDAARKAATPLLEFGEPVASFGKAAFPAAAAVVPSLQLDGFPFDPAFRSLAVACDPELMLDIFRVYLKPVTGKTYRIADCTPFRFRFRQSSSRSTLRPTSRCVMQYTLRIVEPDTGRRWDQWVTGFLYDHDDEAAQVAADFQERDVTQDIPESWRTFEPTGFIPELRMPFYLFPYDRKLPTLPRVSSGVLDGLDRVLVASLGAGRWRVEGRSIEPIRYRTELGAAFRYTIQAREANSSRSEALRCFVKVYREGRGEEAFRVLQSRSAWLSEGQAYAFIKPIAYLPELETLAVETAPGRGLSEMLREEADPLRAMRRVARAVAAFNQDHLPITRQQPLSDQLHDLRQASRLVQWACPEEKATVQEITDAVVHGLHDVEPGPIHGDLKADHVFLDGDRVVFIDLDRAALGDPVRDAAHMYSYLVGRVRLESTPPSLTAAAGAAFVDEYFRNVPSEWRGRFPLHTAGALIEVASKIFRRQEPLWPEKVGALVEEARRTLAEPTEVVDVVHG